MYEISCSFAFAHVESEKYDVSVLDYVLLSFLDVFSLGFYHLLVS